MHPVQQGTGNTTLAQVAELVDALVSNTNAFGRAGSIPALGTRNPFRCKSEGVFSFVEVNLILACYSLYSNALFALLPDLPAKL